MARFIGDVIAGAVDRLIRWIVVPVTGVIPVLISSGVLLVVFAVAWLGFAVAMVANPAALDEAWREIVRLPLPLQGIAWLLFLPLLAGLWVWGTDWPLAVRLVLIAGLGGWNVLMFIPRPGDQSRAGEASASGLDLGDSARSGMEAH